MSSRAMNDLAVRAAALAGGELVESKRLSGGSLSEVVQLVLADGRRLVVKSGGTAEAEARMLRAIAATGAPAPEVAGIEAGLLVMREAPSGGALDSGAWVRLAGALRHLHAPTDEPYGWPEDHAFGKVAILNARSDDWPVFWGERRLRCHVPHVDASLGRRLDALAEQLGDLLPARPPSVLLHGDLWTGNVLAGDGAVNLIDPACYFGDREVDIAMLMVFGSPPQTFFDRLGLDQGWRNRLPIYQLWPLLVHLRLFGAGYAAQVSGALDRVGVS